MAYEFNGTPADRTLTTASTPVTTWPLTMACWFNTSDTINTQVLVHIGNISGNERFLLSAAGGLSGDPVRTNYIDSTNTAYSANTSTGYSASTWTHAAAVHTSNASRTPYINGGSPTTDTGAAVLSNSGLNGITIGRQRFNNTGASSVNGLIAEVGIWNVALTASEIASLADGMTCDKVRPQSLVFYAPLVRDLQDVRGGLTITNNNTATVAAHTRVYA